MKLLVVSCPVNPELPVFDGVKAAIEAIKHHLTESSVDEIQALLIDLPGDGKRYKLQLVEAGASLDEDHVGSVV